MRFFFHSLSLDPILLCDISMDHLEHSACQLSPPSLHIVFPPSVPTIRSGCVEYQFSRRHRDSIPNHSSIFSHNEHKRHRLSIILPGIHVPHSVGTGYLALSPALAASDLVLKHIGTPDLVHTHDARWIDMCFRGIQ